VKLVATNARSVFWRIRGTGSWRKAPRRQPTCSCAFWAHSARRRHVSRFDGLSRRREPRG
jgi:hypothetical protein